MQFLSDYKDHLIGRPALVIGNGKSRLSYDLYELSEGKVSFGCNALYRDFIPDFLVSMDTGMIKEILTTQLGDCSTLLVPTPDFDEALRNDCRVIEDFSECVVLLDEVGFSSSGNTALFAALMMGCDPVTLVGMDGVVVVDGQQNNVYSGTQNYKTIYKNPYTEFPGWVTGYHVVRRRFPERTIQYVGSCEYLKMVL